MAADFPTSLHDFSATYANDTAQEDTHPGIHNDLNEEVAAVQTKIGVDSSAVVTSLDYLLKNTSSTDPGHKHTLANSATDVTATAAELNILDDCTASTAELNITDGGETTEKVLNVQSKARAYLSTSAQTIGNETYTKVELNTESYDVGSDFDIATNHRFVCPVTGYYLVCGCVQITNVAAGTMAQCVIYLNGNAVSKQVTYVPTLNDDPIVGTSDIIYATASQYFELYTWHNSGGDESCNTGADRTFLSVHLLSI